MAIATRAYAKKSKRYFRSAAPLSSSSAQARRSFKSISDTYRACSGQDHFTRTSALDILKQGQLPIVPTERLRGPYLSGEQRNVFAICQSMHAYSNIGTRHPPQSKASRTKRETKRPTNRGTASYTISTDMLE
ncbi:Uu.00g095280.m01.CDS01 [Anthostomella pinea]|uniref:Uu.00g095280.m01.CDS01 n=1 Tax=Anthostomella pinea TaxID=933095 RepID=A0AAI8VTV0_9PEZI|nr:Uu.00g095280.m01.CDS01 [Anthostomella pinea]